MTGKCQGGTPPAPGELAELTGSATSRPGVLFVWTDIPGEDEDDFNEWYNREHVRDRVLRVPGFRRARRFVALDPGPRYLAVYLTASTAVLSSEAYLAIVKEPDPSSRRFIPRFHNTMRVVAEVMAAAGEGEGGFLRLVTLALDADRAAELDDWIAGALLPGEVQRPRMVAASYLSRAVAAEGVSRNNHLRSGDSSFERALLFEATTEEAARASWRASESEAAAQLGATVTASATLQMVFGLSREGEARP
ncbi:DUF4286 family protein [Lutibaculum baratangense]|uniref:Uncharacterized protein n=1 Tax=Lutibaculum baratangense AMV1 TaxID=631454 RepID=V4REG2_9HYPH|nr:DUF4286 family protein [Lutibaculum baratangense]ESR23779.1 hypothetical protein N177_3009 [Lutibaculum baratangense AMV1]